MQELALALEEGQEVALDQVLEVGEVAMGLELDQDQVVVDISPDMVQEVVLDVFLVSLYPFHKSQQYKSHQSWPVEP